MATNIKVIFRDGTEREFKHMERPGGSWTNTIRYEGSFAVIKDAYEQETAFPVDIIKEIEVSKYGY